MSAMPLSTDASRLAGSATVAAQARRDRADWARLILATLARILLLSILGAVFWAALPTSWGWKATTVMSDSMAPNIWEGDVVITMPMSAADLKLGRIILVHSPDQPGELRLHRYVGVTADGELITKGDANPHDDSTPVARNQVVGAAFLRTPFIGLPLVWASQGKWLWVAGSAVGMLGLVLLCGVDSHLRRRRVDDGRTRGRQRRRGTLALGAGSGAIVLALVLSAGAHAGFAITTANDGNSYAALTAYPCLSPAPADNPFFSYEFNETSGTVATDLSGNSRTGTLLAGVTRVGGSCVLNASPFITLNGSTTGQVTTASSSIAGPNTYSVEAWFKTTTTTGGKLVGFGNSAAGASTSYDRMIYLDNSGHVVFGSTGIFNSKVTVASTGTFNNGAWHHVVAVMDYGTLGFGSGMHLYVDGTQLGTNTNTGSAAYNGFWRIGYDALTGWGLTTPTTPAFTGSLDGVAVFTTALSATQVSAHFATGH